MVYEFLYGAIRFPGITSLAGEIDTISSAILRLKVRVYYSDEADARTINIECRRVAMPNFDWQEGTQNHGTDGCGYYRKDVTLDLSWSNAEGTGGTPYNVNALDTNLLPVDPGVR